MKVRIKETGTIEDLNFIDRKTGICCAQDIVGNHGFEGFTMDQEERIYETTQANFDWWETYFERQTRADEALDRLEGDFGPDAVADVCHAAGSVDLEYQPAAILTAIEEYRADRTKA